MVTLSKRLSAAESQARYKAKYPERVKASERSFYQRNKESRDAQSRDRKRNYRKCPVYRRNEKIKYQYKITLEHYNEMLKRQKHCCAVCKEPLVKTPHIDHCHVTQQVRGLLCASCNWAIGLMKDSVGIAIAAANYLSNFGSYVSTASKGATPIRSESTQNQLRRSQ